MLKLSMLILLILVMAMSMANAGNELWSPNNKDKKLIQMGWDLVTPEYAAKHISEMEASPIGKCIDGIMLDMRETVGNPFETRKLDEAKYNIQLNVLKSIKWGRFTDNFLIAYSKSDMDWFSDEDWKWVTRNTGLLAKAARIGKCKGLTFDCEPYGKDPWSYKDQKHAGKKTFAQYQTIVRKRGAQFMSAIQKHFPNPVIHTMYLLAIYNNTAYKAPVREPDPVLRQQKLEASIWNLYPSFVNGMLDAAEPGTVITDGNEDAYYYVGNANAYYESLRTIKQSCRNLVDPKLWTKYRSQVQVAQALYYDYTFETMPGQVGKEQFTPEQHLKRWEHAIYHSLNSSDHYVWLYNEKIDLWQNRWGVIPAGFVEAIQSAREMIYKNEPFGE